MKERILFVDNLRALLILIVVLGHCLQYTGCNMSDNVLYNFIQSFQMPLFMFVSGFVSLKDSYSWNWLKRRCKRLLIPFIVGTFVMGLTFREGSLWEYFVYPLKGLWFLWVLAVLSLLQYLTSILHSRFRHTRGGYLICLLIVFLITSVCSLIFKSILCFDLIAFHFIFYFAGYYFTRFWSNIKQAPTYLVVLLFVFSAFLSISFNKDIPSYFIVRNFSIYVRTVSFIITISFFMMSYICIDKQVNLLKYIGANTLGIYVIHRVLFEFRPALLESELISSNYTLSVFILFVVMTAVSLFFVQLLSRNKTLSLMFLGK